jgi:hypothetical protein
MHPLFVLKNGIFLYFLNLSTLFDKHLDISDDLLDTCLEILSDLVELHVTIGVSFVLQSMLYFIMLSLAVLSLSAGIHELTELLRDCIRVISIYVFLVAFTLFNELMKLSYFGFKGLKILG